MCDNKQKDVGRQVVAFCPDNGVQYPLKWRKCFLKYAHRVCTVPGTPLKGGVLVRTTWGGGGQHAPPPPPWGSCSNAWHGVRTVRVLPLPPPPPCGSWLCIVWGFGSLGTGRCSVRVCDAFVGGGLLVFFFDFKIWGGGFGGFLGTFFWRGISGGFWGMPGPEPPQVEGGEGPNKFIPLPLWDPRDGGGYTAQTPAGPHIPPSAPGHSPAELWPPCPHLKPPPPPQDLIQPRTPPEPKQSMVPPMATSAAPYHSGTAQHIRS